MKNLFTQFLLFFNNLVFYLSMIAKCSVKTAKIRLAATLIAIAVMFILSIAFIGTQLISLFQ